MVVFQFLSVIFDTVNMLRQSTIPSVISRLRITAIARFGRSNKGSTFTPNRLATDQNVVSKIDLRGADTYATNCKLLSKQPGEVRPWNFASPRRSPIASLAVPAMSKSRSRPRHSVYRLPLSILGHGFIAPIASRAMASGRRGLNNTALPAAPCPFPNLARS